MAVVVVAVGAGDEHGPPGPDGVVRPLLGRPRRRALRREADGRLEAGPRPRGAQADGEQQRDAEASGHHGAGGREGRRREEIGSSAREVGGFAFGFGGRNDSNVSFYRAP